MSDISNKYCANNLTIVTPPRQKDLRRLAWQCHIRAPTQISDPRTSVKMVRASWSNAKVPRQIFSYDKKEWRIHTERVSRTHSFLGIFVLDNSHQWRWAAACLKTWCYSAILQDWWQIWKVISKNGKPVKSQQLDTYNQEHYILTCKLYSVQRSQVKGVSKG